MPDSALLVVTPAKNEAQYLPTTIASVLKQSTIPSHWVIVDDGSTDETAEIARRAAESASWITVLRKENDGERRVGVATVHALQLAMKQTFVKQWDFLCVIDADVDLPPRYFEFLLAEFEREPKLGVAAGQIYEKDLNGDKRVMRASSSATAGAVKCWRRQCFEDMGGLIDEPGWDGIDQYQAAMHGWLTRTFDGPELNVLHLRPVGSSHKSVLYGRERRGRSGYFMGSHPIWMLASALFHVSDRPYLIGSIFILKGYFNLYFRRAPKIDDQQLIAFIRRSQMSILRSKLRWRFHARREVKRVPTCPQ